MPEMEGADHFPLKLIPALRWCMTSVRTKKASGGGGCRK